jgi:hypothetical protein
MKNFIRFAATAICVIMFTSNAFSIYSAEFYGTIVKNADTPYLMGGGGMLSILFNSNFGLMYRGLYAISEKEEVILGKNVSYNYTYTSQTLGFEYYIPSESLLRLRLKMKGSFSAGYTRSFVKASHNLDSVKIADSGNIVLASYGFQYIYNQHVSPFVEGAVFHSRYSGIMQSSSMNGYMINLGIRYSLNNSVSIKERY